MDLDLAHLVDIELQIVRDEDALEDDLRERDRAVGRKLIEEGVDAGDRRRLLGRWVEGFRKLGEPSVGPVSMAWAS